jgi:RHH-type rel operon transcriptional repressor/antitoxin RelB
MTRTISARLPEEMVDSLNEIARDRKRKMGEIVKEAVEVYLENWADYKIAVERLNNHADPILGEKEFLDELGWDV